MNWQPLPKRVEEAWDKRKRAGGYKRFYRRRSTGIVKVAEIYNMSRETLRNWINRFKEEGSEGFAVKPGRGRRSKLTTEAKAHA